MQRQQAIRAKAFATQSRNSKLSTREIACQVEARYILRVWGANKKIILLHVPVCLTPFGIENTVKSFRVLCHEFAPPWAEARTQTCKHPGRSVRRKQIDEKLIRFMRPETTTWHHAWKPPDDHVPNTSARSNAQPQHDHTTCSKAKMFSTVSIRQEIKIHLTMMLPLAVWVSKVAWNGSRRHGLHCTMLSNERSGNNWMWLSLMKVKLHDTQLNARPTVVLQPIPGDVHTWADCKYLHLCAASSTAKPFTADLLNSTGQWNKIPLTVDWPHHRFITDWQLFKLPLYCNSLTELGQRTFQRILSSS